MDLAMLNEIIRKRQFVWCLYMNIPSSSFNVSKTFRTLCLFFLIMGLCDSCSGQVK